MTQRNRKLAGIFVTLGSIIVYAWLAIWLFEVAVAGLPGWAHMIYFVLAGLGWLFPAMSIIRWMARPDPDPDRS